MPTYTYTPYTRLLRRSISGFHRADNGSGGKARDLSVVLRYLSTPLNRLALSTTLRQGRLGIENVSCYLGWPHFYPHTKCLSSFAAIRPARDLLVIGAVLGRLNTVLLHLRLASSRSDISRQWWPCHHLGCAFVLLPPRGIAPRAVVTSDYW